MVQCFSIFPQRRRTLSRHNLGCLLASYQLVAEAPRLADSAVLVLISPPGDPAARLSLCSSLSRSARLSLSLLVFWSLPTFPPSHLLPFTSSPLPRLLVCPRLSPHAVSLRSAPTFQPSHIPTIPPLPPRSPCLRESLLAVSVTLRSNSSFSPGPMPSLLVTGSTGLSVPTCDSNSHEPLIPVCKPWKSKCRMTLTWLRGVAGKN